MRVSGQRHAPAALYPRGKDPRYTLDRGMGGLQGRSGLSFMYNRFFEKLKITDLFAKRACVYCHSRSKSGVRIYPSGILHYTLKVFCLIRFCFTTEARNKRCCCSFNNHVSCQSCDLKIKLRSLSLKHGLA
jgi:hypothetical protein